MPLSQQLWWSKHKLTHSVQGGDLFHLLICQNGLILKSYHPLLNGFILFFNRVQVELGWPQRESHTLFTLNPIQCYHLFQSEKNGLIAVMCSTSGWSAGDTCQRRLATGEMRQCSAIGLDYTPLTVAIAQQWGAHFSVDLVITSSPR